MVFTGEPMRGLELIMWSQGQWEALKSITLERGMNLYVQIHTHIHVKRLLDWPGPEGQVSENLVKVLLRVFRRVYLKSLGKKVNVKKWTFLCLNMKQNKSTGHQTAFLASLFSFYGPFWPFGVWAKNCLFFKKQIFFFLYLAILN